MTAENEGVTNTGIINKNLDISRRAMFQKEVSDLEISDLQSGMFVRLHIYSKCLGLLTELNSTQDTVNTSVQPDMPLVLNYTLKYGSKRINWVDNKGKALHKASAVKLQYMLG